MILREISSRIIRGGLDSALLYYLGDNDKVGRRRLIVLDVESLWKETCKGRRSLGGVGCCTGSGWCIQNRCWNVVSCVRIRGSSSSVEFDSSIVVTRWSSKWQCCVRIGVVGEQGKVEEYPQKWWMRLNGLWNFNLNFDFWSSVLFNFWVPKIPKIESWEIQKLKLSRELFGYEYVRNFDSSIP